MNRNVYYIPIMCCGQPMSEIYNKNEERIAAVCQVCGNKWEPPIDTTLRIETIVIGAVKAVTKKIDTQEVEP